MEDDDEDEDAYLDGFLGGVVFSRGWKKKRDAVYECCAMIVVWQIRKVVVVKKKEVGGEGGRGFK